jgi:predicted PurR-regulated permease PerM
MHPKIYNYVSYALMAAFLLLCFHLHLMSMLIAGMVVFSITNQLYKLISPRVHSKLSDSLTLAAVISVTLVIFGGLSLAIYYAVKVGNTNIQNLEQDVYNILQQVRQYLPNWLNQYIPEDMIQLKEHVLTWAKNSSSHIFLATSSSAKILVHVIIGMILGALVAFSFLHKDEKIILKPFNAELLKRISIFANVFSHVVFAQVKISSINTMLTAAYLYIALPLFGIDMPYSKTMVLLTFLFGLIPVLGNLIVNVVVVAISLTVAFKVAVISLIFLIVVHKLEYYINAKIVGSKLKISIWELLIAMVLMESIFGVIGVVLAPVIYGYIKEELKYNEII